jgi:hypothetical protein
MILSKINHHHRKIIFAAITTVGALLTLIPSFLNWLNLLTPAQAENLMLIGTILWFLSVPNLLNIKSKNDE